MRDAVTDGHLTRMMSQTTGARRWVMCHRPVRGSAGLPATAGTSCCTTDVPGLPAGPCGVADERVGVAVGVAELLGVAAGVVGAVLCDGLGSVLGLGSSETLLKISEPNGMRPAWAA